MFLRDAAEIIAWKRLNNINVNIDFTTDLKKGLTLNGSAHMLVTPSTPFLTTQLIS